MNKGDTKGMDIQFAILGLLSWQPFSGYDLKKIISESDLFYWSGSNNQIYNSLVALHKAGFVTQEIQYQEALPAKKIYSITDLGREQLQAWLVADPELPEMRSSFLIQLAWADHLPPPALDNLLARYEDEVAVQLRMHQEQAKQPPSTPNRTGRERYLWRMIAQNLEARWDAGTAVGPSGAGRLAPFGIYRLKGE